MTTYLIMVEGCAWREIATEQGAETVYRGICSWYRPQQRVAILNEHTGKTQIFTRTLDNNGNIIRVNKTEYLQEV